MLCVPFSVISLAFGEDARWLGSLGIIGGEPFLWLCSRGAKMVGYIVYTLEVDIDKTHYIHFQCGCVFYPRTS